MIRSEVSSTGVATIAIEGRFDFTVHREFKGVCDNLSGASSCVVDMKETSYLDSSALGMLLILRERVPAIRILNCSPGVRRVLEIANFQQIFAIE